MCHALSTSVRINPVTISTTVQRHRRYWYAASSMGRASWLHGRARISSSRNDCYGIRTFLTTEVRELRAVIQVWQTRYEVSIEDSAEGTTGNLRGDFGIAAASRCWRKASSLANCFFLLPMSPLFVLRKSSPKLDRRTGCEASGVVAKLSEGGDEPALGVPCLVAETIVDWIRMCRGSYREYAVLFAT
jgi:hypothetical protein